MSNLNQSTQSKPLGDGVKAGTTTENRILYVLLFVLIAVFFWKVASDDNEIMDIKQDKHIQPPVEYEEVISTTNSNVDVEIMDADLLVTTAEVSTVEKKQDKKNNIPKKRKTNPDFYKSYNLKQMPITNGDGFDNIPAYDYNYIFAGDVNVPEGTFVGMDDEGFAILMEKKKRALLGGVAQVQTALPDEFYPKGENVVHNNSNHSNLNTISSTSPSGNGSSRKNEDSNTGVSYGDAAYPLEDTLGWHPYESLAYPKEEKKVYVAKKVRDMPTPRDLEPYIPPSTLGDKDTRMGYGVVIRPRK